MENPQIGYLIWQIRKAWQRHKSKSLAEFGITLQQGQILGAIHYIKKDKHEEVTQIALSQETGVDPMTISTLLKNLQEKGLIVRKESKTDSRAKITELTEEGQILADKLHTTMMQQEDAVFQSLDKELLSTQLQLLLDELRKLEK